MPSRTPIFILGGSDSEPGPVPEDVERSQMLDGYKGTIELPVGHCLAQKLIERIRSTELFHEPVIFGPRRVYDGSVDCRIVDIEGNLANTLRAVRTEVLRQTDPSRPVPVSIVGWHTLLFKFSRNVLNRFFFVVGKW